MRKIVSKEEEQKKRTRNQVIVGGILIIVMLFSTLGYAFQGEDEEKSRKINYNGFEFSEQNNYWILEIGGFTFTFKNNPNEVPKITSELNKINNYSGKPLYLVSENKDVNSEIYNNLGEIVQRMQLACLEGEECGGDLPTKNCESNLIVVRESEIINIAQENNCVYILGPVENLTQITDEFLLKIIGVDI